MANNKKSEEQKKVEEFVKTVQYNRKNTPGFDSLYKLILWFIFIFFILILFAIYGKTDKNNNQQQTTTVPANAVSYKSLLDERKKDGSSYVIDINVNNTKSRLNGTIKGETVEGVLEGQDSTDKFIIKDGEYYIVKFDEEKKPTDFALNLGVINLVDLIKSLENNKSLKTVDQETNIINYKYDLVINNIAYEINTKVEDKKVSNINVKNENSIYDVTFK